MPAPDPLLRLLAGAVGEPDDREGRQPALQVRLDLDPARLEADERVGDGAREHAATLGDELVRVCAECVTKVSSAQAARATSTSSKYSPARRPVRRLTCRW